MDVIKPFVDFNFSGGSKRTKSLISKYYNKLSPLIDQGYKPQKAARERDRRLIAEKFDVPISKRLKAVPVPPGVRKVKIKDADITYNRNGVITKSTRLNRKKFASDTRNYVDEVTRKLGGDRFRVRAGRYYVPGRYDSEALKDVIERLQRQYANWQDWMDIESVEYDDE